MRMSTPAVSRDSIQHWSLKRQPLLWAAALLTIVSAPFLVGHTLSQSLFRTDFLPHIHCYLGKPGLVWTNVIADSLIAVSYLAISVTLVYLVYRAGRDIPFHWIFLAFGLFIVTCGATHLVEAVTIWNPVYVFLATVKVLTATASLMTAVALPFAVPRVTALIRNAKATQQATADLRATEGQRETLLEELLRREAMFERFFNLAPDAILVTDAGGLITAVNQQTTRMFGFEPEELVGKAIEVLVPETMRSEHRWHREKYFAAPKLRPMGYGLDLYARRKDGSQCPVDITLSPMGAAGGENRVMAAVRDMTEHKLAQQKIEESLREKDVLLREIHHRVKNNLAVICSLFYLESTYAKDEHAAQVFRESENRVHSMALVHESLYGSKDLSRIDFSLYAKALATDILSSYGNGATPSGSVQLKSELQPVIMSIDLAVPCGLILNELISNACKHGFPNSGRGEITVAVANRSDGQCMLRVDDNGAGIPPDVDVNSKKSLGLRLVRSLTKQIRGSFELVRNEPGTSARVQFPIKTQN
jgi:PAS domain S-box-containing protein